MHSLIDILSDFAYTVRKIGKRVEQGEEYETLQPLRKAPHGQFRFLSLLRLFCGSFERQRASGGSAFALIFLAADWADYVYDLFRIGCGQGRPDLQMVALWTVHMDLFLRRGGDMPKLASLTKPASVLDAGLLFCPLLGYNQAQS